jgi:hypothetical protein
MSPISFTFENGKKGLFETPIDACLKYRTVENTGFFHQLLARSIRQNMHLIYGGYWNHLNSQFNTSIQRISVTIEKSMGLT